MNNLFNYYSIDECTSVDRFHFELDKLVVEGKIQYEMCDRYVAKIFDIDLDESEIIMLTKLFDSIDVFPYLDYDDPDIEDDSLWGEDDEDQ